MRSSTIFWFTVFLLAIAETTIAQVDMFQHVYWEAKGTHAQQQFGFSGMDTLGKLNDTIPHALSIGSDGGGSFVYNRFPLDTLRHYKFPGNYVRKCNLNGDKYPDYVCWDDVNDVDITVLLGTARIDSFKTAFVLHEGNFAFANDCRACMNHAVVAYDADSDGYDDILIAEPAFDDSKGRIYVFKGGPVLDSLPTDSLIGISRFNPCAGLLAVGHVHNNFENELLDLRWYDGGGTRYDTIYIASFTLGKKFRLFPKDTIMCLLDTVEHFTKGFCIVDVDNDSIQDILLGRGDAVMGYKGGTIISSTSTFQFSKPHYQFSTQFGDQIIPVDDMTGKGYPSLLVTDPEGDIGGGYLGGTVYLYNLGKALKDSCVAVAAMSHGFENYLGTRAIALGDISGDGRADIMVGRNDDDFTTFGIGAATVFLGDESYGPDISGVAEHSKFPTGFRLDQNFPNPFSAYTDVTFAISNSRLQSAEISLDIEDIIGRRVLNAFTGTADGFGYTIRINASQFVPGMYLCRLSCGGYQLTRKMIVVK